MTLEFGLKKKILNYKSSYSYLYNKVSMEWRGWLFALSMVPKYGATTSSVMTSSITTFGNATLGIENDI